MKERILTYSEFLKEPKRKYLISYDEKQDVILIYRDWLDDEKIYLRIKDYPWYFCILKTDYEKYRKEFEKMLEYEEIAKIKEEDSEFVRIYCEKLNVRNLRDHAAKVIEECEVLGIQTFEADLNSYQRCHVDHNIEVEDHYKILYFDIETDDRGKGIVIGRDQILSFAAIDEEGKIYYKTFHNEKKLLKRFIDLILKYDLIIGWNSEKFDIPYLRERMKEKKIWFNWRQIVQVDLMQKFMEINKRNLALIKKVRSFALNNVSKEILGEEKVQHKEGIYEMFESNPKKLKKYNIQDVVLLKKLNEKVKILDQKISEHQITSTYLNEFSVSRILDNYILRNSDGHHFKSKPPWVERNENEAPKYTGGIVLEQVTGIHNRVYHFDFTSLYPSIIRTFNISPETLLGSSDEYENGLHSPAGYTFVRKQGIIPRIISGLLEARDNIRKVEMKDMKEDHPRYQELYFKQYAFKTISNSFYGILGAPFTRWFELANAESITKSGHYLIMLVKHYFESLGCLVIYGDTDSVFLTSPRELDLDEVYRDVNLFIAYHLYKRFKIRKCYIDLKVEAVYDRMLLPGAKKKYAKVEHGELKVMGFEARRRETLPVAGNLQMELLTRMLIKKQKGSEIQDWLETIKLNVLAGNLSKEEVTLQVKLSKDVHLYDKMKKNKFGIETGEIVESKLPHIKVAKWLKANSIMENDENSWEKGSYVKFIITGKVKGKGIQATSIYNYEDNYDRAYYWDVKIFAMLERILSVSFPEIEWYKMFEDIRLQNKAYKQICLTQSNSLN